MYIDVSYMGLCILDQCIYTFFLSPFYLPTFDPGGAVSLRFAYNTVLGLRFRVPRCGARASLSRDKVPDL